MRGIWVCGVLGLLPLVGCSSSVSTAASDVASEFYRTVTAGDGAAACDLLAPQTIHELEQSSQAPCRMAILQEDIPEAGEVVELKRFGSEAQVRLRADTAFLAEFDKGWKVVAVSCASRGDLPYDCRVSG